MRQFVKVQFRLAAVAALFALPLASCASHHDVAYYLANPTERAAQIAACQNNPGDAQVVADCKNAEAAELAFEQKRNDEGFTKGMADFRAANGMGPAPAAAQPKQQ
jgi:predicted outer membrane protein